jgi:WD40 repeat protein
MAPQVPLQKIMSMAPLGGSKDFVGMFKGAQSEITKLQALDHVYSSSDRIIIWDYLGNIIQKGEPLGDIGSFVVNEQLYYGVEHKLVRLDLRTGKTEQLIECMDEINMLAICNHNLGIADDSGAISIVDLRNMKEFTFKKQHDNIAACLAFRNDKELLSGGYDQAVIQWDLVKKKNICSVKFEQEHAFNPPFICSMSFKSPEICAIGLANGFSHILHGKTRQIKNWREHKIKSHSWNVTCIEWLEPSANCFLSGSIDKTVALNKFDNKYNSECQKISFDKKINAISILPTSNIDSITFVAGGTSNQKEEFVVDLCKFPALF